MTVHSRFLLPITIFSFLLTACGGSIDIAEGPGVTCIDPNEPVNYLRSDWRMIKGEDEADLRRAHGDDVLKGMQPTETISGDTLLYATFVETQLKTVTGITGESSNATSYENALDLMEEILTYDEVTNFVLGRGTVLGCIQESVPHRYNNQEVAIGHEDLREAQGYIVDYNYPKGTDENGNEYVIRTILPTTSSTFAYQDSYNVAYYSTQNFTTTGYDQPYSMESYWQTEELAIRLQKQYDLYFQDTIEIINSEGFAPTEGQEEIKRLKLRVNYQSGEVEIYTSDFMHAYLGPDGSTILKDITNEELDKLFQENPEWEGAERYYDPGYDTADATPLATYIGTLVPHRG